MDDILRLNLVLFGPPGSGKGTQSRRIAGRYGIPQVCTGDILRAVVKQKNECSEEIKLLLDAGNLVDDSMVIDIVRERLVRPDVETGFVLDGFPRTVKQASFLDSFLEGKGPLTVFQLLVSDDELVDRIARRRICSACGEITGSDTEDTCSSCGDVLVKRSDDHESSVRERLQVYHQQTMPVLDYYQLHHRLIQVNGAKSRDNVTSFINNYISEVTGLAS